MPIPTTTTTAIQIRWMIRRDMPEILAIERECFEYPWTEEDFLMTLRQRNVIGMVADDGSKIHGYVIYELLKGQLHVLNFAVAPWLRREGLGTRMVQKLKYKLSQQRRTQLILEIRETNLDAQRFFRSQGFLAYSVLRGHYTDTDEDAFAFCFDVEDAPTLSKTAK